MGQFWSLNKRNPDRVPPTKNTEKAPKNGDLEPILGAISVAGAEGLELSARGFGVAVEKLAGRIATGFFRGVEPFQTAQYTSRRILMIYW